MSIECLVFADIDGTLTPDRSKTFIDHRVIPWLRRLDREGYKVVLVSGNSLPVLRGLSLYLGLSGDVIAENGCVVYLSDKVRILCRDIELLELIRKTILSKLGEHILDTWQNMFRFCDRAFKWKDISEMEALNAIMRLVNNEFKRNDLTVTSSGYAIHIHYRNCDKGEGIKLYKKLGGYSGVKTYCIGDSETDVPMRKSCNVLVAVSNSDNALRSVADVILSKPSSEGFIEFAKRLIENNL